MPMRLSSRLTIRQACRLLESGAISSVDLATFSHSMAVAGEAVWGINAYEKVLSKESILENAEKSDFRRKSSQLLSVLDGIPCSVKSNFAVADFPLTAGSRILGLGSERNHAVGYDADVVRSLITESGAILIGITAMDEFGMGSLGNTSPISQPTKNPLPMMKTLAGVFPQASSDKKLDDAFVETIKLTPELIREYHEEAKTKFEESDMYSAGGSSCGSAASVAHGSAIISLGTDTGGSVRLPSSWCGLVGLKPSYGVLSRHGVVSYASSFDTVGILGNSVECASLAFDQLVHRGGASHDSTISKFQGVSTLPGGNGFSLDKIRIGIPSAFTVKECPRNIADAWSKAATLLEQKGASVVQLSNGDIDSGLVQSALAAYYVLVSAEASSNLSRYDGFRYGEASETPTISESLTPLEKQYCASRTEGFGTEVSRRILCGTSVLSSDHFHTHYEAAAKLRATLGKQMSSVLNNQVDAILIPTSLSLPPRLGGGDFDQTGMFANDIMTVPSSLAGLPTVTIPVDLVGADTFKAGMSLIGRRLDEHALLRIGQVLESTSG